MRSTRVIEPYLSTFDLKCRVTLLLHLTFCLDWLWRDGIRLGSSTASYIVSSTMSMAERSLRCEERGSMFIILK